jgi:hypothetical protein
MSFYLAENNDESTKDLYQKRVIYSGLVKQSTPKHVVNFHVGEKFMYGRINRFHVPIVLRSPSMAGGLKSFDADLCRQENFYGNAFVVNVFHDMVKQYQYAAYTGKIEDGDAFLSELQIYKAYQNPNSLYNKQVIAYSTSIKNLFRRAGTEVANFGEFVKAFLLILQRTVKRTPFTQSAFVKSKYCPMLVSGLAIEIADLDPANDHEKIEKFLASPNWEYFVNLCNQFGFMIDQFVPWRIVADIDSEIMREYASEWGADTPSKMLSMMYTPAYSENYKAFKNILLQIYDNVKREFVISEKCGSGYRNKTVTPISYTLAELEGTFSEQYFLDIYCKIRFWEEESTFKPFEQNILTSDCLTLAISGGPEEALDYFERIINKPFDYRGSLSYIKKQVLAQIAEDRRAKGFSTSSTNDISGY